MLNLSLLINDKVVLLLSQLLLLIFRGFLLLHFLFRLILLSLWLLVNSVTLVIIVVVVMTGTTSMVSATVTASVATMRRAATRATVATSAESSLAAIFAGSSSCVDSIKIVIGFSCPFLSLFGFCIVVGIARLEVLSIATATASTSTVFFVVRPLVAVGGCLYLFIVRGIRALSCE